jgi:hypothetical protein
VLPSHFPRHVTTTMSYLAPASPKPGLFLEMAANKHPGTRSNTNGRADVFGLLAG